MKLISVSVARPRLMVYKGATINTGIFKKPVSGRIALRTLNLDGDRQADLSVHGGIYKAVYLYPPSITYTGGRNFLTRNCHWAFLERILELRASLKTTFTSAIAFESVHLL